jgi:alanine racemase
VTVHSGPAVAATGVHRRAWAEIDLGAIRANAAVLAELVAPAELCAVVKAWGYGHGPVAVAEAALEGGATWLAVALVEEGQRLRAGGVTAPILLLSEPRADAMAEVVRGQLTATLYTRGGIDAMAEAVRQRGPGDPVAVHVKVDTGMHRVGATPDDAVVLARQVADHPALTLDGLWTHFAVADETEARETADQLAAYLTTLDRLGRHGVRPRLRHVANSAGALFHPASRLDMVRCGIALYGLAPAGSLVDRGSCRALRPALSLAAEVSHVKVVAAGERLSYGLRYRLSRPSVVATIPLGYADGVTRRLSDTGGQVLIGGRRHPIAGSVTMDQILVDCGPDADVAPGDVAVLLGPQGDQEITAWEWAERVDTIAYEVVCGVTSRVPRVYRR